MTKWWTNVNVAWRQAWIWTITTKVFLMMVGWFAWAVLPTSSLGQKTYPTLLSLWGRWDSAWFVRVATQWFGPGSWPQNPVFLPGYPGLIRAIGILLPHVSLYSIGAGISWAANVPMYYFLYRLVEKDFGDRTAHATLKTMAFYPLAFFFSVAYSEALFMALALGAFYLAREGRWFWVGLLGFGAALVRNEGAFLFFPLVYEYWKAHGFKLRFSALSTIGGPLGILSFMVYLKSIGKNPMDFMTMEKYWGRQTVPPWTGIHYVLATLHHNFQLHSYVFTYTFIDFSSVCLTLLMAYFMIRSHYRPSYIIWTLIIGIIPLMSITPAYYSAIPSASRFVLPAFPMFIMLAQLAETNHIWNKLRTSFPGFQALFFAFWILYYWIA